MFLLFFFFLSHNKSYADSNISYSYRKGSTTSTKSYSYGTAFKEKTTKGEGIACSNYANCYVGCSCQSGWTQPSSGEYVWATDAYYTGVNAMSVSSVSDVTSLIDGKSAQSTSGDTQVVSLSGGISTMSSSGGITCYKAACSSGYYLDAPNSTYFTSSSTTGTIGLTCYKATGCQSGYSDAGTGNGDTYHGLTCKKEECPSGYYYSASKPSVTHMIFMSHTSNTNCYKPGCAIGYSSTVNGSAVAEWNGYKCYKNQEYWPTVLYLSAGSDGCDLNGQPDQRMCYFRGSYTFKDDSGRSFVPGMYKIVQVKNLAGKYETPTIFDFRIGPYLNHVSYADVSAGWYDTEGKWTRNMGMAMNGKTITGYVRICFAPVKGSTAIESICVTSYGSQTSSLDVVLENTNTGSTKTYTLRVEGKVGDNTSGGGSIISPGI